MELLILDCRRVLHPAPEGAGMQNTSQIAIFGPRLKIEAGWGIISAMRAELGSRAAHAEWHTVMRGDIYKCVTHRDEHCAVHCGVAALLQLQVEAPALRHNFLQGRAQFQYERHAAAVLLFP